ncbi:uncharacterized protein LOC125208426 isoform X2 [Salvia hispanica]|uniref:uncharacterized protein LOC125206807 isoform X2 n=1 Tax=Salvia hispanica TaxID=49212 RepID=UPI0020092FC1|nr:uncharacterized protein LOC125206807 isoform X2 [Salvia hispanica]XP_047963999.1 uncharacterized protein LOC125208426 isoform X2 [Salvia hispanica]
MVVGGGMNCGIYRSSSNELWPKQASGGGAVSHESEHDLALMVNDFLENGNSCGADSRYSSDSDSSLSDLLQLADKISYFKMTMDQYENDLLSVVNSLALSINERDLHVSNSGLCTSRWQGSGKVPGGDHEYIDVIRYNDTGGATDHVIIDINFRSQFEIARAVDSYDRILNSLPVIYVGSFARLKQFLQVMVEAARFSLKQNSMPLPPWRSLAYLQAKWQSPHQRRSDSAEIDTNISDRVDDHKKCAGHLMRLHSLLLSEIEVERTLKPYNRDRRAKTERRRYASFH